MEEFLFPILAILVASLIGLTYAHVRLILNVLKFKRKTVDILRSKNRELSAIKDELNRKNKIWRQNNSLKSSH